MLTAFLPCRKGSQRVPHKNVKDFCGIKGGLLNIKLTQLCKTKQIDKIIVSSNDEQVLDYAKGVCDSRIFIDERPGYLGSSSTTTDELIQYVPTVIDNGDILWTHVTSPFISELDYKKIIDSYYNNMELGYDSLMTVHKLQGFIWDESKPLSYKVNSLKWPMTQNIKPFYEVDSGVFLSSVDNYCNFSDRIGINPFMYCQDRVKSMDIDWPSDFEHAEVLWKIYKKN